MKLIYILFYIVGILNSGGLLAGDTPTLKVLMIGNSLTYTYAIPSILENMALAFGKSIKVTSHVAGGKSLMWHWTNASGTPPTVAPAAILSGHWDVIILQDISTIAKSRVAISDFEKVTREYVNLVNRRESQVILYMGFVRQPNITEALAKEIVDIYTNQARFLKVNCAPVALSFIHFREKNSSIALLDNQVGLKYARNIHGSHQSPFGAYLAAATLFSAIFNKSPVGNRFRKSGDGTLIEDEDALLAQQIAWDTWISYEPIINKIPTKSNAE